MLWVRSAGSTTTASYAFGTLTGTGPPRCYYTGAYLSLRNWGGLGNVDMAGDLDLLTGWNHVCVVIDDRAGMARWYLNGMPSGTGRAFTPSSFTFQAGNLIVGSYSTTAGSFTRYFDIDDFRVYARALTPAEIATAMASESPAATTFGDGCAGPATTPSILAQNGAPALGNAVFRIEATDLEAGRPQAIFMGLSATGGGTLPLDISLLLGASYAGCEFEVLPDLIAVPLPGTPSGGVNLALSNDPILAGLHVYAQAIVLGSLGAASPALDVNLEM
jgi:hypothetical protein